MPSSENQEWGLKYVLLWRVRAPLVELAMVLALALTSSSRDEGG